MRSDDLKPGMRDTPWKIASLVVMVIFIWVII